MSKFLYKHEYNNLYREAPDGLPVRFLIVNSVIYKSHKWIFACLYLSQSWVGLSCGLCSPLDREQYASDEHSELDGHHG